jgi:hypothetical protein
MLAHKGPINKDHLDGKGSTDNFEAEGENGEATKEPLSIMAWNDPVSCKIYA